ncbi:trehalase-like domain-containing protein [Acidisoma silvae]|uniref:Trehalase-like N-terminal domain-containing protein n=1 Tax=Acidisoma silvae TaxID=2802396 RepID=A0A964DZX6_9PROT|nr:trehalase-like domain-containing protein [Acidisoma silvae]MCB8876572.1 hypothetical protein [Acidisoma silvae]
MPMSTIMAEFEPAVAAASDHSVIGDGSSIALVSRKAEIDFLCWPDFSHPTLFARLEASDRGVFTLAPDLPDATITQSYMVDTNVLITQWQGALGRARIVDILLPDAGPGGLPTRLIRQATAMEGHIPFRLLCRPRPNDGTEIPATETVRNTIGFRSASLPDLMLGRHDALRAGDGEAHAEFTLKPSASAAFILSTRAAVEYHTTRRLERLIDLALAKQGKPSETIITSS